MAAPITGQPVAVLASSAGPRVLATFTDEHGPPVARKTLPSLGAGDGVALMFFVLAGALGVVVFDVP